MRPFLLFAALLLCCKHVRGQEVAAPGEFAHVVRLRVSSGFAWNMFSKDKYCSGAIIDRHWVLTAATCVNYWKNPKVQIYTGHYYTTVITADKVVVPDRHMTNVRHNIALIWLKNGISGNYRTADIAAYRPNDVMAPNLGSRCRIFGWNSVVQNNKPSPNKRYLFHEQLPVKAPINQQRIRLEKVPQPYHQPSVQSFTSGMDDIGGPIECKDNQDSGRYKVYAVLTEDELKDTLKDPWHLRVVDITGTKVNNFQSQWIDSKVRSGEPRDENPSWTAVETALVVAGTGLVGYAGAALVGDVTFLGRWFLSWF